MSLARPDWKNNWKFANFRPTWRSLLTRRPGWTENIIIFFWVACKSYNLVAVACFLPGRAKDLSAPQYMMSTYQWDGASELPNGALAIWHNDVFPLSSYMSRVQNVQSLPRGHKKVLLELSRADTWLRNRARLHANDQTRTKLSMWRQLTIMSPNRVFYDSKPVLCSRPEQQYELIYLNDQDRWQRALFL